MKQCLPEPHGEPSTKRQSVSHPTFVKWRAELDKDYHMTAFLWKSSVLITVSICGGMAKLDASTSSLERNTGDIPQKLPTQRMVTFPTAMQRLITFH